MSLFHGHSPRAALALSAVLLIAITAVAVRDLSPRISITPLRRSDLLHPASSSVPHYFEANPNQIFHTAPPFANPVTTEYLMNSDGLNESHNYATTTAPRTFRIVTLGDSWTFGKFVKTEDNFSERLEVALHAKLACPTYDSFEVINLGVPGLDMAYAVERFRIRGQKYHPALLIWLMLQGDYDEINEEIFPVVEAKFPPGTPINSDRIGNGSVSDAISKAIKDSHNRRTPEEYQAMQERTLRSIQNLEDREILLLTANGDAGLKPDFKQILEKFDEDAQNVQWHESPVQFREANTFPDGHPNALGHEELAQDLFEYVRTRYLPECSLK